MCSGSQTFTATGLPCNATVSWSVSPSGIASLTSNGNQATVTKVSDGVVTLSATVHTNCIGDTTVNKTIVVGTPSATISGPSSLCPCTCCNLFSTIDIPGATYHWTLSPTAGNSVSGNGSQAEVIITNSCTLDVQITTSCGTTSASKHIFLKPPAQCHGGCSQPSFTSAYTITPNPAQNTVAIRTSSGEQRKNIKGLQSEVNNTKKVNGIKTIRIYTVSGKLTRQ